MWNKDAYAFKNLYERHGGFKTPVYKIKVGSRDLNDDLGLYADGIEISQTVKDSSGMCKFTVKNAYDIKARKFDEKIKENFPLGKNVEARLGYGQPKVMFKGFVSDVSFSFSQGEQPSVSIACLDVRALMKQGRLNASMTVSSFPVIAMDILRRYACMSNLNVTYFDVWNVFEEFRQNASDFNYIYNYGQKRGYEFFVLGEDVYFIKKWLNLTPVTTLEWGEGLISFSRNYSYNATNVKGALSGMLSALPFTVSLPFLNAYPAENPNANIQTHPDTSDSKNALDLAAIMVNYGIKTLTDSAGGSVSCVGLPEITPARFIKLKNLDADFLDRSYYIEEATHKFSSSGYTTDFNITSEL